MLAALAVGCGASGLGEHSGAPLGPVCEPLYAPGYCPSGLVCDTCDGEVVCDQDVADPSAACVGPCPAYGTWTLTAVACGEFAVDDWFGQWAGATLTLEAQGDECVAEAVTTGTCPLGEVWRLDDATVDARRIDETCAAVCEMPNGELCDGETTTAQGELEIGGYGPEAVGLLAETVPACAVPVTTFWTR